MVLGVWEVFGRGIMDILVGEFRVCDTGMMCVAGCFDCAMRSFDYVVIALRMKK